MSDMTDEELDKYFATYVPLSNLPTPPPVRDTLSDTPSASALLPSSSLPLLNPQVAQEAPELEVYATQLSNLVPSNASPHRPSLPVVRGILERSKLPVEIIAFAACILDALTQRFASSWRACLTPGSSLTSKFDLTTQPSSSCPELILLSALALAHDFIDDRSRSTRHWSLIESRSLFSVRHIDATKFCILEDMHFGLFRITPEMVDAKVRDLQRPAALALALPKSSAGKRRNTCCETDDDRRPHPRMSLDLPRAAVWVHGMQTPEPSP
ncbi:hypothetical protein BU24DRAFT_409920 [Aaosphaeria arxii CBS 175.79]|uniref:Cyclin N-terminal domain-containing protein n=1 Tax=Aaosphaeria arxii CBS 175.79 TaxID=1450172 RepID=A0A6A5XP79_9PLEO|nr:uncharacterized protein BU24DRAFT_409920 [Aaosphaeria arxii CBS 175.79]KAF2014154.1 hypothetical protein BU24DRAFT_409920 [Aaosphaeria arxii CBS 175.79]